ncbi:1-acyl-sn-glycerol-3-phosphate acyltransferase [Maribacter confluentis]|uniref:1-acyl-sn-glycerol-3-phosphate acyltransferase n=1 Tax=Maribacter confluentis TaxID=1656093 RepID=A0ABT8RLA4_9FLAO|nr:MULTISPECIES: 1-acyl-sn-glycerol-3-phosphate acyltransferase [Maribacter]MDO1511702.1 1-acyl-sn-glycerol-3-phosphate acyltransferase [Maribacter confluentis]TVZ14964.1 1-acyl-sn-glycerol-3-phosphate acyltransferase [Maribacter sp. MAR_2009_72]
MQQFAKFIYFRLLGWKIKGRFPSELKKFVLIVVPHTSWWDFLLGLLVRKVWDEEINYIGKKSLFDSPFGWFFRWTGGAPIDRSKTNDTVKATAQIFNEREKFRLSLSPEGTRKKVEKWKTGFYFIAKTAHVPIVLVAFDYGKKEIRLSKPEYPTDDQVLDFKKYHAFFDGVEGKHNN